MRILTSFLDSSQLEVCRCGQGWRLYLTEMEKVATFLQFLYEATSFGVFGRMQPGRQQASWWLAKIKRGGVDAETVQIVYRLYQKEYRNEIRIAEMADWLAGRPA